MRHKKTMIGLLATLTLAGMSTASAQPTTPPPSSHFQMYLSPTEVQPGGTIQVWLHSNTMLDGRCGGAATSPGFVAPIKLTLAGTATHGGSGQVITKAGDYVAAVPCTSGDPVTAKFKILNGSMPSPPPSTSPSPPPTRVTPIGPPQTGGGGTARSVA